MLHDIEQKFLEFLNFGTHPTMGFPPSVGIEIRKARGHSVDHDSLMTQRTVKHSAEASGVTYSTHNNDWAEPLPPAPGGKHGTFVLGSGYIWDLEDSVDAKRPELPKGLSGFIFVGNSAANELVPYRIWGAGKNCDPCGYTAVKKVSRLKRSGAIGIERHDYDVGGLDGVIHD
jgi:hypothetical protein